MPHMYTKNTTPPPRAYPPYSAKAHLRMGDETDDALHDSHGQDALFAEPVANHGRRHALVRQVWPDGHQDDVCLYRGRVHPDRVRHPQVVQTLVWRRFRSRWWRGIGESTLTPKTRVRDSFFSRAKTIEGKKRSAEACATGWSPSGFTPCVPASLQAPVRSRFDWHTRLFSAIRTKRIKRLKKKQ